MFILYQFIIRRNKQGRHNQRLMEKGMMEKRVYIIAEAGVNHNGSLRRAGEIVDAAWAAGANAVNFQTFRAEDVVTSYCGKARYQKAGTEKGQGRLEMLKRLELDEKAHRALMSHCAQRGIEFLSTPFDLKSVELLVRIGLKRLKLSSGEITNAPLLLKAASTGKPIILSTGMSTLAEVGDALGELAFGYLGAVRAPCVKAFKKAYASGAGRDALKGKVILLHCTTVYPAPFRDVNLRAMDTLRSAFSLPAGLSDHTEGTAVAIAAVARGASVIEKHFTLDKLLPGPGHLASLEPDELKDMVRAIRNVEDALGSPVKKPAPGEIENMAAVRKSLVASRNIKKGELFAKDNIAAKRPGNGVQPFFYWEFLGKKADKDFKKDEFLKWGK